MDDEQWMMTTTTTMMTTTMMLTMLWWYAEKGMACYGCYGHDLAFTAFVVASLHLMGAATTLARFPTRDIGSNIYVICI